MWEVTVLQTFFHPDLSLRVRIFLCQVYIDFPEEIKDFFFGAQIPPAKPCLKLKMGMKKCRKDTIFGGMNFHLLYQLF